MGRPKKPGTRTPGKPGRLNAGVRPSGKTGGLDRRLSDQDSGRRIPQGVPQDGEQETGLQKRFNRANRRLQTLQVVGRQQRAFLSLQTHQMRAQLHAVMGYAELVLRKTRGQLPGPQVENLKKLLLSVEGLKDAIEGLRGFPFLDAKKSPAIKIRNPNTPPKAGNKFK